ncbi:PIN domain-containing protein [Hymenobacter sp. BT507]|uniref:Ribonuclease VapC n=1 Tax=Hymenobacter citatus TaxID=2763506 RepID=A0ABR7MS43_9BACT|nr:PIN domain-containing protein [Hymenobacter citatus]MBC6613377.1 PIN domain-containing protein [Hymenobacter citatus]
MIQYVLDTNICVHFLKNEHQIPQQIAAVGFANCYLSELTIAELLFGVANSAPAWQAANRQAVEELRLTFAERILLIGPGLEYYAQQKVELRKKGRPVDDMDLLIGVTAMAHGFTLVTRNTRHFADIDGLSLQNWVDQPIAPLLRLSE